MAAQGAFAEDQLAVERHFEDAVARRDQLGLESALPLEVCRQTGGDGLVVSDLAVFDGQIHDVGS
jgi:hypothetical protein